ncbi:MAG: hypothetical protein RL696_787 [Actinomycetota bacterium]
MDILTLIFALTTLSLVLVATALILRAKRARSARQSLATKIALDNFSRVWRKIISSPISAQSEALPTDDEARRDMPAGSLFELDSGEFITNPLNHVVFHGLVVGPTGSGKTTLAREIGGTFQGEVLLVTEFPQRLSPSYGFAAKALHPSAFLERMSSEIERRSQQRASEPLLVIFDALERSIRDPEFLEQVLDIVRIGSMLEMQALLVTQQPWLLDQRDSLNFGLRVELSPAHSETWNRTAESLSVNGAVFMAGKQGKLVSFSPARSDYKSDEDVRFASTPLSGPGELCAPFHRSPWDPSSAEEQPEQQDRLGHQHGHKDQRHTRPYSKTL